MKATIGRKARGWGEVRGWSSSAQPSGEAQISPWRPDSGVGDQPNRVADPEEGSSERSGLATGGGELAGHRSDGQEHDGRGHHGQGQIERGPDRDLHTRGLTRQDRDDRGDDPQDSGPGA